MSTSLGEDLPKEIKRCRELLEVYKQIGPIGIFGHTMISADIEAAENAIIEGDVVAMLGAYHRLQRCS